MLVFRRQGFHRGAGDVGRVGENQIVAFAVQRVEQVGFDGVDVIFEAVVLDVVASDGQRILGEINGVDLGIREGQCHQDGQTAGAGAKIQGLGDVFGFFDPGGEAVFEQLGEVGARDDDPFIDVETMLAQPGLLCQVGSGQAFDDAPLQDVVHGQSLVFGELGVEEGVQPVQRQVKGVEDEPGGFVKGVVAAVTKIEARFTKAADGVAQPVPEGVQFVDGGVHAREDSRQNRRSSTPS